MTDQPRAAGQPEDQAALVQRAVAGDPTARSAISDTYAERIHRYLASMLVGQPHAVDDLAQETFRRAFDKLGDLRQPDRLAAWIYSIAINLCRAWLRARVDAPQSTGAEDPPDLGRSVLSSIVRRESAAAVALAIDRLPILLREAFVLHIVEGLPYADIAEMTGASEGALQVRTHRAKALLRRQLGAVVETFWVSPPGA